MRVGEKGMEERERETNLWSCIFGEVYTLVCYVVVNRSCPFAFYLMYSLYVYIIYNNVIIMHTYNV